MCTLIRTTEKILNISSGENDEVLVIVNDILGKLYYSKIIINDNKGSSIYAIDPTNKLSHGIYVITATSQDKIFSKRLIIK